MQSQSGQNAVAKRGETGPGEGWDGAVQVQDTANGFTPNPHCIVLSMAYGRRVLNHQARGLKDYSVVNTRRILSHCETRSFSQADGRRA